jgi:hypothetical protein
LCRLKFRSQSHSLLIRQRIWTERNKGRTNGGKTGRKKIGSNNERMEERMKEMEGRKEKRMQETDKTMK